MNTKVNNWAVEISPYRIHFEYIKGIKNTLADTMSRLIQIDPEAKLNPEPEGYEFGNFEAEPAPMKLISMDLIGEFHPPSSKGNRYTLTVICMFTGYTFCIPLPDKKAETVLKAYMNHVYCNMEDHLRFYQTMGQSLKISSWKRLVRNWEWNTKCTHLPIGNSLMEG